jgi:hypothetical protein
MIFPSKKMDARVLIDRRQEVERFFPKVER